MEQIPWERVRLCSSPAAACANGGRGLGGAPSPSATPIAVSMGASVQHWERGCGGGGGIQTQQLSALVQTLAKNKTAGGAFAKRLTASTMFQSPPQQPQPLQAESARDQERMVGVVVRENNRMKQELEMMKAGGGNQQQQPASTVPAVASMQSGTNGGWGRHMWGQRRADTMRGRQGQQRHRCLG